jgi:Family of unknown function (DUF5706)
VPQLHGGVKRIHYIKFGDAKAGALLGFNALLGGALGFIAPTVLANASKLNGWPYAILVLPGLAAVISIAIGSWRCLESLAPRTPAAAASLCSFPDIAKQSPQGYAAAVTALTPDEIAHQYALHNSTLARVAETKFSMVDTAVRWARFAVIAMYVFVVEYVVLS